MARLGNDLSLLYGVDSTGGQGRSHPNYVTDPTDCLESESN